MNKKNIIILISVLLLLVLVGFGVYLIASKPNPKTTTLPPSIAPKPITTKVNLNNPPIANQKAISIPSVPPLVSGSTVTNSPTTNNTPIEATTRELLSKEPVPTIDLIIEKDASQGYNLTTSITNFRLTNKTSLDDSKDNVGYIKLYVNNKFATRIYSSDYYIKGLSQGNNQIRVELADSKGRTITKNSKSIAATTDIIVK